MNYHKNKVVEEGMPSPVLQFSDLVLGEFFKPLDPVQANDLYIVARATSRYKEGCALGVNDAGKTYTPVANRCFPQGVRRVEVEIKVLK